MIDVSEERLKELTAYAQYIHEQGIESELKREGTELESSDKPMVRITAEEANLRISKMNKINRIFGPKTPDEEKVFAHILRSLEHDYGNEMRKERAKLERKEDDRVQHFVQHLAEIAPLGGKATAHYTDEEVTRAFTDFKQRNSKKSAWDAANALIREGKPLSRYKKVTGPWNRIKRIAKSQSGVTLEEWFDEL